MTEGWDTDSRFTCMTEGWDTDSRFTCMTEGWDTDSSVYLYDRGVGH